jgi:hypothetical protein
MEHGRGGVKETPLFLWRENPRVEVNGAPKGLDLLFQVFDLDCIIKKWKKPR